MAGKDSKTFPVEFSWPYGGSEVYVAGSWSAWTHRTHIPVGCSATLQLPGGLHHFKFVVDGAWREDPALPTARDAAGNTNNVVCSPQGALPAATFNLRYGTADDGQNSWEFRRDGVAAVLRKLCPAVIMTQEALDWQLSDLECAMLSYTRHGIGRYGGSGSRDEEWCAVLVDRKQAVVEDSGTFWLSEAALVPGSRSWGSVFPRVATWVVARLAGKPEWRFLACSTHLDYQNPSTRLRQSGVLAAHLDNLQSKYKCPVVLGGDFNTAKESTGVWGHLCQRAAFEDAWTSAKKRDEGTSAGFTFNNFSPSFLSNGSAAPTSGTAHIDWLLLRNHAAARTLVANEVAVVTDPRPDGRGFPSDHFPVFASFSFQ